MSISMLNEMLKEQNQHPESVVDQTRYAELDELAVPEFSRLFVLPPDSSYLDNLSTVITRPQ